MLKNSEIGYIPNEWKVDKFKNLVTIVRGGSPRPIEQYLTHKNDGVNWIKIGDVSKNAKYITSTKEKISESGKHRSREVFSGDFILSNSMSFGRPYILKINGCIHDGWLAIQNINKFYNTDYLYYFMSSKIVQEQYKIMAAGSSVQNLNKDKVGQLNALILDKKEQEVIAEYLSSIDLLIENKEKLIEKKQLIKQGVMQELLSGEKRLCGYDKEWYTDYLKNLAKDIKTGKKNNEEKEDDGKYPFFVRSQTVEKINSYSFDGEAILIPGEGNIGKIFHYINGKFDYHQRVYKISNFQNVSGKFLYFYLSHYFGEYALKNTVKATVDSLRIDTFHKFKLFIPKDLKEQESIANILTDIDQEINSLEQDLEKYKQIKQGMMEQLLTGKIRLVKESDNVLQTLTEKKHNQHFDDAVVFANIVASCYDPDYPLGRKKCQKMMYLFKRFNESSVEQFKHYAAGPYDNKARYGGFETIAIKNKYVVENKSAKGSSFVPGPEIEKAKAYCSKYGYDEFIPIFNQYLKYKKVDELELYTTVDKTILELKEQGSPINLKTVKAYISNDKTWVPKLSREVFNDENIEEAIRFSQLVLGA